MAIGVSPPRLPEHTHLSPAQRQAVEHGRGPLLIVAGAGSGKTRALTYRVAHLIRRGTRPDQIMVATFTNKAAEEFRERLRGLIPQHADRVKMSTLHSAGAQFLRGYGEYLGYERKFVICDPGDTTRLVRGIMDQLNIRPELVTPAEMAGMITGWKERLWTAPIAELEIQAKGGDATEIERRGTEVLRRYDELLLQRQTMDFADLIRNSVRIMEQYPETIAQVGLEYLLVDEFQDTDPGQFRMIQLLISRTRNLTAVGDVDQAIYAFRGADPSIMTRFREHLPDATVISLGQNYRSTQTIVATAAEVIQNNQNRIQHRIWTENGQGFPVYLANFQDDGREAQLVAEEIVKLNGRMGIPYSQIAVLYRTNRQSQALEHTLVHTGVPYVVRGNRFFERPEVRDTLAYLRWLYQPRDATSLEHVVERPPRDVTRSAWEKVCQQAEEQELSVWEVAANPQIPRMRTTTKEGLQRFALQMQRWREYGETHTLPQTVEELWRVTGLREWHEQTSSASQRKVGASPKENLDQLMVLLQERFPGNTADSLELFLDYAALLNEDREESTEAVQLLTLHASKGLEWRAVFLIGVEHGLLPHHFSFQGEECDLEEERRLFYVGMTRARELLYLSHASYRRNHSGGMARCKPSDYLTELPQRHLQRWNTFPRR